LLARETHGVIIVIIFRRFYNISDRSRQWSFGHSPLGQRRNRTDFFVLLPPLFLLPLLLLFVEPEENDDDEVDDECSDVEDDGSEHAEKEELLRLVENILLLKTGFGRSLVVAGDAVADHRSSR
jgi:hypothetical protein